jgi:hypothetical protein
MSTTPAVVSTVPAKREITIVSHSTLFYWWPVWAVGFLLGFITMLSGSHMVVVPSKTEVASHAEGVVHARDKEGNEFEKKLNGETVLIVPAGKDGKAPPVGGPGVRVSQNKNLGVVYAMVLLLVIFITNVPLRGLWSVIAIVIIICITIIFALLHWWEYILTYLSFLDIRINEGGYFTISTVLFIVWLLIFLLFDQQIYMVFTPGQLRVRLEIGEGETAYDTTGMTIQKQRSDLFRHWILGLGSGDLIVRTSGAQSHQFDLPNVLFLGRKVKMIEEMLRSRAVVAAPPPQHT